MSENTLLDLEQMMDGTLDNVVAAPEFLNPPPGDYMLTAEGKLEKFKNKNDGKEGARIRMTYKVAETVQLASTDELPVPDGSMFSETFTYSEEGLKYFKARAQQILNVKSADGVSIRDLLGAIKETEAWPARLSIRTSSKDGKDYENVNIRVMHSTPAQ